MSEAHTSQPGDSDPLALLAGFSQSTRLLKLTTPLGADALPAECVRGEEGIGTGFSFNIAKGLMGEHIVDHRDRAGWTLR